MTRAAVHVAVVVRFGGVGGLAAVAVLADTARGGAGEGAAGVVNVGAMIGFISFGREVNQDGRGIPNIHRTSIGVLGIILGSCSAFSKTGA